MKIIKLKKQFLALSFLPRSCFQPYGEYFAAIVINGFGTLVSRSDPARQWVRHLKIKFFELKNILVGRLLIQFKCPEFVYIQ